jgi:hypothetical protein
MKPKGWQRFRKWDFAHKVALMLLAALLVAVFIGPPRSKKPDPNKPFPSEQVAVQRDPAVANETAQALFEKQLETYKEGLAAFVSNMQLQAAVTVVALMLLCRQSTKMEVPMLGMEVSISWLHFLVPVIGAYLWVMFGYQLNALIDQRLTLWSLLDFLQDNKNDVLLTKRNLLADSGFIEAWFISSWPKETLTQETNLTKIMFGIFFGGFLGLAHASVVVTLWAGGRRFLVKDYRLLAGTLPVFFLALIIATHFQFAYQGHNPNWFQLAIAFWWIVSTYALAVLYLKAESLKRSGAGSSG